MVEGRTLEATVGGMVEGSVCNCGFTEALGNFENKRNNAGAQCKLRSPELLTDVIFGRSEEPSILPVVRSYPGSDSLCGLCVVLGALCGKDL